METLHKHKNKNVSNVRKKPPARESKEKWQEVDSSIQGAYIRQVRENPPPPLGTQYRAWGPGQGSLLLGYIWKELRATHWVIVIVLR